MADEFDYVIVGAGSAGCTLAHRLSEDAATKVLLVEAGGSDRSIYVDMPSGFWALRTQPRFDWGYETEPEPHLAGRRMLTPRGRALGGSSTINGQMYMRGHPLDYDNWADMGASGWSFAEVLPYFKRAERFSEGGDEFRGDSGPLRTTITPLGNPLYRAFLEAGQQAGYAPSADLNGYQQDGFGASNMTVATGKRCSAARAYLHPIRGRPNLQVVTHALSERVVVEGNRATGVAYSREGVSSISRARREVILSAGAVNSPQLLLLSGIGPGSILQELGIPVVNSLPGVGENLMDHVSLRVQHACREPVSRQPAVRLPGRLAIGLQWMLFKSGVGASNQFEATGYVRSQAGVRWPDLQLDFIPFALDVAGDPESMAHGFQTYGETLRSPSRGWVRLGSSDPKDAPRICCNYLSRDEDWEQLRASVRLIREIHAQPAFDRYRGPETQPGPAIRSGQALDDYIRDTLKTVYHLCGTCRMGSDSMAVTDEEGRVHGIEALRVVDASLMPHITSCNTNAPTIMMAEKISDAIRGLAPLPRADVDYYQMPDWQTRQRPGTAERPLP